MQAVQAFLAHNLAPGLVENLVLTAVVILIAQVLLWALSLRIHDASIVDIFWGPGFALIAVVTWLHLGDVGVAERKALIVGLTCIWALRLALYVYWRGRGKGEDPRYTAFRRHATGNPDRFMLRQVFLKQGRAMWITSIPLQVGQYYLVPTELGIMAALGVALWLVGFTFETLGDWQLARFKADPANAGRIMDRGLWRYTRHPNYFGDACVWWGLFFIACDNWLGLLTIFAPLRMTHSLINRTGKKLLEKRMLKTRPAYAAYVENTNGFFPWFPRKPQRNGEPSTTQR